MPDAVASSPQLESDAKLPDALTKLVATTVAQTLSITKLFPLTTSSLRLTVNHSHAALPRT